jgi:hypothetical protein
MQLWMGGIAALPSKGRSVINIRAKFAVFYGKVDQKRDPSWYWTSVPGPGEPLKGTYNGPFETKAEAVEDANQAPVIEEKAQGKFCLLR